MSSSFVPYAESRPHSAVIRDALAARSASAVDAVIDQLPAPASEAAADGGASLTSLRELYHLRSIAIGGQAVTIAVGYVSDIALNYLAMLLVLGGIATVNVLLARRLRRAEPASRVEVLANLMVDLAAFTAMLLLSGGTANPFALLYLLHVALIGLLLPRRLAIVGCAAALVGFAASAQFAFALKLVDGRDVAPALMTAGRCVSFALTAVMIAWFVNRMSTAVRLQQMLLEDAARRAVNDEALMRIGTIATGAAHELSTPLTSMGILVHEWQRNHRVDDFERDVGILASQIDACKDALANLRAAARGMRLDGGHAQSCAEFLRDVQQRFRAMRPDVPVRCDLPGDGPMPTIETDAALKQALLILLDNAADACSREVVLAARWTARELEIAVIDDGSGIPADRIGELGRTFFTTKGAARGNGLGVMLAAATAARLGGTISWSNREEGGAIARMRLPLSALTRNHNRGAK